MPDTCKISPRVMITTLIGITKFPNRDHSKQGKDNHTMLNIYHLVTLYPI